MSDFFRLFFLFNLGGFWLVSCAILMASGLWYFGIPLFSLGMAIQIWMWGN